MHPEMPQLYALHEIDARLLQLDRAFRKLDHGATAQADLDAASADLARAEDSLKQAKVGLGVAESALKANETKQAQENKRLYGGSVVNTREAEAVAHEIAALKTAAGDLETEILEFMDAIEAGEKAVAVYRKAVEDRQAHLAAVKAAYEKDSASVRAQAAEVNSRRAAALAPLSAAAVARYDSARKRTKDTGIAVLDGHTCEGCHMQVPGVSILKLKNGTDLINCDNCGRILYIKG